VYRCRVIIEDWFAFPGQCYDPDWFAGRFESVVEMKLTWSNKAEAVAVGRKKERGEYKWASQELVCKTKRSLQALYSLPHLFLSEFSQLLFSLG
jgi:hypothetical protein